MGKKFLDKKKSATFCLLSRDSSDPVYTLSPDNDRVFVRVDNNPVSIPALDDDDDYDFDNSPLSHPPSLPLHLRTEILELGFPDDGYNYLTHLRDIRHTGAVSAYYPNPKLNLLDVPDDVKAYDASRVRVAHLTEDAPPKILYKVAEKSVNVRIQKAVDPDIAKLLDEAESDFGSDVDGLEEDFVVKANILGETSDVLPEDISASVSDPEDEVFNKAGSTISHAVFNEAATNFTDSGFGCFTEKPRVQRLLDQQFDLLERQEYGTDSDDDYYDGLIAKEEISLAEKLNNALKDHKLDGLEADESYKAPAVEIVRRCVEYAEKYENEEVDDSELVIVEESSDESENFDCETIVSTYSNLNNHPGRINAPEFARKKRLAETISGALKTKTGHMISLGGKDKLPIDYLPNGRKATKEKPKPVVKTEPQKRKSHGQESKEEKKERKAAVKEERREARRVKKELKGVYRGEATRAQKVAADSGPSSIHLS